MYTSRWESLIADRDAEEICGESALKDNEGMYTL